MLAVAMAVALAMTGPRNGSLPADRPAEVAPSTFNYYYFDQPQVLTLDETRLAIRSADDAAAAAGAWLEAHGLRAEALADHAVPNWHLVALDEKHQGRENVTALMQQLAADDAEFFLSPVFIDSLGGPLIITQDILVRFRSEVTAANAMAKLAERNLIVLDMDWAGMSGAYRVRSQARDGLTALEQANDLARLASTEFAEPDVTFTGTSHSNPPNDEFFQWMWGLHNTGQFVDCDGASTGVAGMDVGALEAWKITRGDPSVIVVVLDDGVQLDHPDLNTSTDLGEDFTGQDGGGWPVNPCDRHGTPVAGCTSARIDNGIGGVGVAPESRIASARPFISNIGDPCTGSWSSQASWTVNALDWAENVIGARVSNNSNGYGFQSSAIAAKYADTRASGMVHFASAGNSSTDSIGYPASLPSVNAIAALDQDGDLAWFSNWGEGLAFSAPGRFIIAPDRTGSDGYTNDDYMCFGGTSAASPYAAGVAALIVSRCAGISAEDVEQLMAEGAIDLGSPGYNTTFGWGLTNAAGSLSMIAPADLNCDGTVGIMDLSILLEAWGACENPDNCHADFNSDGVVDGQDLLVLLQNWG